MDAKHYTKLEEIPKIVAALRASFETGKLASFEARRSVLRKVRDAVEAHAEDLCDAMARDLGKPRQEAWMEVLLVSNGVNDTLAHLEEWLAPEFPTVPLHAKMDKCQIRKEPLGIVLNISPFNYPLQLALLPAMGAIAAGNPTALKLPESTPAVSLCLGSILADAVDSSLLAVVQGAVAHGQALLSQRWDHIFYTGSTRVGRIVMQAAAKHLTPVTLELGGKSPAILLKGAQDYTIVAQRIAWGRYSNCGQVCFSCGGGRVVDCRVA